MKMEADKNRYLSHYGFESVAEGVTVSVAAVVTKDIAEGVTSGAIL